jgi:predicted ATPase/class 3 adenylate cyclase
MPELPTGTVTFLFTDIEGSTRLLTDAGAEYGALLEQHRRLVRDAVEGNGGTIFGTEGDAMFAAFDRAGGALAAAADAQRALLQHPWPDGRQIRARAGIHSGEVTLTDGGYVGLTIHEVARISAAGHGGQVLVSSTARELTAATPVPSIELRDLGEHRLKDLAQPVRLYQLAADGLPDRFPPLRTLGLRPNNLPVQLTSFIDREELGETRRLLNKTRLLTFTGPGGTGKTRLGLQLAAEVSDDFSDGVFFVPLDALRDPDVVPSAIVNALGLPAAPSNAAPPLTRVIEYLRDRSLLLVLDNFEQIVDGAPVVAQILREAPRVKVIVTSRIPLRVSGEQEFPIPSLGLPERDGIGAEEALQSEAVLLFVERAAAARPDFQLGDQNVATVVDIVRRLDGLPLAIELAAARVGILSVEALRERLDKRLAMLTGGPRDKPARHQTLRGTMEWSYELLEPPDRDLFERFGVFASAACLVEAEPICGPADELGEEVLDGLVSLSEKSLLRPVPRAVEEPRFAMLATIREYAVDRLARRSEADALRRRHAETYLALVEACAPHLLGPRGRLLLDRLEQDHDNLRLALDWALERGDADFALRFAIGAWRFWQIRGHLQEGWERVERILALPDVRNQPPALRARALGAAGSLAYWRADVLRAHEHYREALELARASEDPAVLAEALNNFGFVPLDEAPMRIGPTALGGRPYFEEAIELYRRLGDRDGLANATWALAETYVSTDDFEPARRLTKESLALYRETDNRFGVGWALFAMATLEYRARQMHVALRALGEALQVFAETGDVSGIAFCLLGLSVGARAIGERERYWRLSGATQALGVKLGMGIDPALLAQLEIEPLVRPTDDVDAQRLWDEGAAMPINEAVQYGLEIAATALAAVPGQMAEDRRQRH